MKIINLYKSQKSPRMRLAYQSARYTRQTARRYRKLIFPTTDGLVFEPIQQITALSSDGNYTRIFLRVGREVLVSRNLSELEASIGDPDSFVRIHRSHLINLRWLQRYERGKGGVVHLEDGRQFRVSAARRDAFLARRSWPVTGSARKRPPRYCPRTAGCGPAIWR